MTRANPTIRQAVAPTEPQAKVTGSCKHSRPKTDKLITTKSSPDHGLDELG